MKITLKTSEELAPTVELILKSLFARLNQLVPDGELHHIGATAIPGALTKGDLDVLVRVTHSQFSAVVASLNQHFDVKQRKNWAADFASFGDDNAYHLPVGIQVVVKGSENDFLLFLRDFFIENPQALAESNRIKAACCDKGATSYWAAKNEFLSKILAARK